MPTRQETSQLAWQLLCKGMYPNTLDLPSAWLGIYQVLLWYEKVHEAGFDQLPHIIDADKLRRPPSKRKAAGPTKPNAWQLRASAAEEYLARELNVKTEDIPALVDQLIRHPNYKGMQRQNPLGMAFVSLVARILAKYGSKQLSFEEEVKATSAFPGFKIPGRSTTPSIDILVQKSNVPRAVISVKWSLRHDRVSDITGECPAYKAVAQTMRYKFDYVVVTNEFDPSRINKLLADSCIDAVAHVHKPILTTVCKLDGRLSSLMDLSEFVELTKTW